MVYRSKSNGKRGHGILMENHIDLSFEKGSDVHDPPNTINVGIDVYIAGFNLLKKTITLKF